MKSPLFIFLFCLIITFNLPETGAGAGEDQFSHDLNFILKHQNLTLTDSTKSIQHSAVNDRKESYIPSELSIVGKSIIKLYQTIVSSQDYAACNFYPSCSHFAADAFEQSGFVKGVLLTADRLSRCHWFARPQKYQIDLYDREKRRYKIFDPANYYQSDN